MGGLLYFDNILSYRFGLFGYLGCWLFLFGTKAANP